MISPKIDMGSNVEILRNLVISLSSRSTRSHIISSLASFRLHSFHGVGIPQVAVTCCNLLSISYHFHRRMCLSLPFNFKCATRSPLVSLFVFIFVVSFDT
jgi:hypothetical protein